MIIDNLMFFVFIDLLVMAACTGNDRGYVAARTQKDKICLQKRKRGRSRVEDAKSSPNRVKKTSSYRRIKREWKDAVELGIAYDWERKETVTSLGRSPSGYFNSSHLATILNKHEDKNADSSFFKYNYIRIGPMGKNLLRWHFSVLGPPNSVYANGIYHGRILLPRDYPASPPRIQLLTPSGRFVTNADICLSASAHHPESWTPRWTVLSLVDALRIHMLTTPNEIGGLHASPDVRKEYANLSRSWPIHRYMISVGIFSSRHALESCIQQDTQVLSKGYYKSMNQEYRSLHHVMVPSWRQTTLKILRLLTACMCWFLLRLFLR